MGCSANASACDGAKLEGAAKWFHDDLGGALACAKATNKAVIVDLWAPWCHTCLSMKTTVFSDPQFAKLGDEFVFAAFDTDRESNANVVKELPLSAWPTFYVIDSDKKVLNRLVGSANLAQFVTFAKTATLAASGQTAQTHLLAGHRAMTAGKPADAQAEFAAALGKLESKATQRTEAVISLLQALSAQKLDAQCVDTLVAEADNLGTTSAASDSIAIAVNCAERAAKSKDQALPEAKLASFRTKAIAMWTALVDNPTAALSADDRSDAMMNLRELLLTVGDEAKAREIAGKQLALLDAAAAAAKTPLEASTYNWPRSEVYVFLGRGKELVAALEKSVADLPSEYDPPYRLAWVHHKSGEPAKAIGLVKKALELSYGPRKAKIASFGVEVARAAKDEPQQIAMLNAVIAAYQALPPSEATQAALQKAQIELAAITAANQLEPTQPR